MKKMIFAAACAVLMLVACTTLSTATKANDKETAKTFEKSIEKAKYEVPPNG
jgi:outer membrane biogenesis lipoprotein LolB